MKYRREQIVSDIYETSKSQKAAAMFPASAKQYAVYDLDKVKDEFCLEYRHGEKIKSCDAYYYDKTFCKEKKHGQLCKNLCLIRKRAAML